jgi:tripeptide aminopeptidase
MESVLLVSFFFIEGYPANHWANGVRGILSALEHAPFTSPLAAGLAPDLLARLERYVRIDTQSARDRTSCPSTPGQLELARALAEELLDAGLVEVELDENGYVTATLPAGEEVPDQPVIGLVAHMDTSPDAPGRGVEPVVHRSYGGGVIELPRGGTKLDPARMPELSGAIGHDIVTASGDTLLGADDKAGVAEIMTAIAHLVAHPELPRPTIRVGFTPDEEIGEGATLFDIERFGARCAYTLDGSDLGELQDESFNAIEAIVTVRGIDVHPGQAAGKLVNALRVVSRIVAALPEELSPERTSGREGFIHPYELTGSAARASLRAILRDFDDDKLDGHVELLRRTAEAVVASAPGAELEFDLWRQYRNMRRYLESDPEVVAAAEAAYAEEGIAPMRTPIRGGTDGSRLSEMGLPTPNIFTGGHEYHSVREWASIQEMAAAAATVVRLAEVWTRPAYANAAGATRRAG